MPYNQRVSWLCLDVSFSQISPCPHRYLKRSLKFDFCNVKRYPCCFIRK
ncbi:conserved protein of unknown function [Limnospira indica PCC 8005]|uniref:Uncharacterized protein n=1 Tax=Limnospira indica PCC 8005 TaxID=376219 RepID=A0A9P1KFK4_9CYAN|nr:conserved protein of unknown function [Limnospira indica PCC 8005]